VRFLGYVNHANMGIYGQAVNNFLTGKTPTPEITDPPLRTTIKYGFGINFEQPFNDWIGLFGRWGWNEGERESFAYTEVDQTWQLGVGAGWYSGLPYEERSRFDTGRLGANCQAPKPDSDIYFPAPSGLPEEC
jgi:high affinity Mn2+ porin